MISRISGKFPLFTQSLKIFCQSLRVCINRTEYAFNWNVFEGKGFILSLFYFTLLCCYYFILLKRTIRKFFFAIKCFCNFFHKLVIKVIQQMFQRLRFESMRYLFLISVFKQICEILVQSMWCFSGFYHSMLLMENIAFVLLLLLEKLNVAINSVR